jgi:hypothetical protein
MGNLVVAGPVVATSGSVSVEPEGYGQRWARQLDLYMPEDGPARQRMSAAGPEAEVDGG